MSDLFEEIPPGTDILNSLRAERAPFYLWAGEAIDNSLDASATWIALRMNDDELLASDNGDGITKASQNSIIKLGQHDELRGTRLGRFGVGIKYKAIQHGYILKIVSTSVDGRMTRRVDWQAMQRAGKWMFPRPEWKETQEETGTTISIEKLIKKPAQKDIDRALTEIQRRYYPALESGVSISLNGAAIQSIAPPDLTDVVSATRNFPGGRSARLHAGMLRNPLGAKLRQVDLVVSYRVIKPESQFGCDGYGGIRAMHARLDLLGAWELTKFKDDLADDPYEDELEEWVEEMLRPILEKCESNSVILNAQKLQDLINEMLPDEIRAVRPKRQQELDRQGPKRGLKLVKEVDESEERKDGPVRSKKKPRGILVEFVPDLNEEFGYGRSQIGKSTTRIQLAADNPHIKMIMENRDQVMAAIALIGIATLIYEGDLLLANPRLMDEPTGLRAWKLGKQQNIRLDVA